MGRLDDYASCDTVLVLGLALYSGAGHPAVASSEEEDGRRRVPKQEEDDHLQTSPVITNTPRRQGLDGPTGGLSEPSLTLALSGEATRTYGMTEKKPESQKASQGDYQYSSSPTLFSQHRQYVASCRSLSSTSTFSSSSPSVKRARSGAGGGPQRVGAEEAEVEVENALAAHAGLHADAAGVGAGADEMDDEAAAGCARKKLRLTKDQSALLEERFKEQSTLNPKQKLALAKQLNLRPRQVEVWFQNRRARTKLKQTEVDCDFLRRCCEALADENRRLHRELQELKAINFTPAAARPQQQPQSSTAMYLQVPVPPASTAGAFTMCPGCQKIRAAATDVVISQAAAAGFAVAPKSAHVM